MFVQVACTLDEEEIMQRRYHGLIIGSLSIAVGLILSAYTEWNKEKNLLNYISWDVNTVTSADYTVKFLITKEFWEKFKEKKGKEDHYMTMS